MDAGIGILGILSLFDAPENISLQFDIALRLISQPPVSLHYLSTIPYPYLIHVSFPSISVHYLIRGEHHSLHLVDMLSSGPEVGAVELKLQIRCLC